MSTYPYPGTLFDPEGMLSDILEDIIEKVVSNSSYTEGSAEIIALRDIVTAIQEATNSYINLDSYPPGAANTRALRRIITRYLSGSTITEGTETIFP